MGRALRSIPTWAWLAAIVVASTGARALLARGIVAPFIMVDEVIWSELARGFAAAGKPLLRDQPHPGYSPVYPLLISPAYALFDNLPQAYAAVKTLNSLLMSLAAVPAFFLARRVVSDRLALLAALLTVAVPSLAYTGTVMTENAFYPLFLLVALALVRVLERPSPLLVVLLFGLVAVAYGTRVQAVAPCRRSSPPRSSSRSSSAEPARDDRALRLALRDRRRRRQSSSSSPSCSRADCSARTPRSAIGATTRSRCSATCGGTSRSSRCTSSSSRSPRSSCSSCAREPSTRACRRFSRRRSR